LTENERLKTENEKKFSTLMQSHGKMDITNKSLYTSMEDSFYLQARRETIKSKANDLSMSMSMNMRRTVDLIDINLLPCHLPVITEWVDYKEEYDVARKRRKSF